MRLMEEIGNYFVLSFKHFNILNCENIHFMRFYTTSANTLKCIFLYCFYCWRRGRMGILDISWKYIKSLKARYNMFTFCMTCKTIIGRKTPKSAVNAENYHYSIFRRLLVYPVSIFVSLLSNDPPPPLEITQKREHYPPNPLFSRGEGGKGGHYEN